MEKVSPTPSPKTVEKLPNPATMTPGNVQLAPTMIGGELAGPEVDLTGKTLGDFQVLRRLGEGGMGQVYLAEQLSLKRKVALKIMRAELAANPTALQRFKAEAEAVARITHANIVQVYAIGELNGMHYMALEYVDGRNLREHLARKGPPELPLARSIMRQVTAALQRAGELGIVHRDIKPDNILLSRKGEVKVADFGLVRCFSGEQQPVNLTQSGVTVGTPLYMSPEQVQGKPLDTRTDMYSFGVTCYHMLAGHPPYRGETAFEVALQHVQGQADPLSTVRPDLPPELCAIVEKMMAKKPEDRFQTGGDLLKELMRLGQSLTGQTSGQLVPLATSLQGQINLKGLETTSEVGEPRASRSQAVKKPKRRKKPYNTIALVAVSLVIAVLAGAALAAVVLHNRARPPESLLATNDPAPERNPRLPNQPPPGFPPPRPMGAEHERFLLAQFEQFSNPRNDFDRADGLRAAVDLGTFYLESNNLPEAERFFGKLLETRGQPGYPAVGRLGMAIVLGLRGDAKASYQAFMKCRVESAGASQGGMFLHRFGPSIMRAMEENRKKEPVPKELLPLLNPPEPPRFGQGQFPKSNKQPRPGKGEKERMEKEKKEER